MSVGRKVTELQIESIAVAENVYNFNADIEDDSSLKLQENGLGDRRRSARFAYAKETSLEKMENKNQCTRCDRSFQTLKGLKQHQRCCGKKVQEILEPGAKQPVLQIEVAKFHVNCKTDDHSTCNGDTMIIPDLESVNANLPSPEFNILNCMEIKREIKSEPGIDQPVSQIEVGEFNVNCKSEDLNSNRDMMITPDLESVSVNLAGPEFHILNCMEIKREIKSEPGIDQPVSQIEVGEFNVDCKSEDHITSNGEMIIPEIVSVNLPCPEFDIVNCTDIKLERDPRCLIEEGKCDCCGENIETAHVSGDFECPDCQIFFKGAGSLARHRQFTHNEGETFNSNTRSARCPDKKIRNRHSNSHRDGRKPVSCPVCHNQFTRKSHLIRHNVQTGCDGTATPSFTCQICFRQFRRKDNLDEHLRAHTGQTKRKKTYFCEFCNKQCTGTAMLKQHRQLHTGDKPHICDMCPNRFASSGALRKHRRKHTGERPYECKQCHSRFAAKETLNRHMRTHTGIKPHSCSFCGKGFIQASQLRAHIIHHTGEKMDSSMKHAKKHSTGELG